MSNLTEYANSIIEHASGRLANEIESLGGNYSNSFILFKDCLEDTFTSQFELIKARQRLNIDFIASGEAAVENKAEVNRNWYLEIMQNSEFKDV